MRYFLVTIFLLLLCGFFPSISSAEESSGDSTSIKWGILHYSAIDLRRASSGFPWNAGVDNDCKNNRVAAMMKFDLHGLANIYLKGAAEAPEMTEGLAFNRFMLDESHIILAPIRNIELYLFSRERIFADDLHLLKLLSNQSVLDYRDALGGQLVYDPTAFLYLRLLHVSFQSPQRVESRYGLPFFSLPYGTFNQLRVRFSRSGKVRFGVALSELGSISLLDNSVISADLAVRAFGAEFMMEFAKGVGYAISRKGLSSEVGPRIKKIRIDRLASAFNDNEAFAVSLYGLEYRSKKYGSLTFEPGYRYVGERFVDSFGEAVPGNVESEAVMWWKHPRRALIVDATLREETFLSRSYSIRNLNVGSYARFKSGIELRSRLIALEGRRLSMVGAFVSRYGSARLEMTGRIDELGSANRFSFISQGWMNLGKVMNLGCTFFLSPAGNAYYSLDFELRHGRSFLGKLSYGSFNPCYSSLSLERDSEIKEFPFDRRLLISTRFYLGSI